MAEQIGLLAASDGITPTDSLLIGDCDAFCGTNTPFIHGRDYTVDAESYRRGGDAEHSRVTLTYRLWGEPIKYSGSILTGNTTNGNTTVANVTNGAITNGYVQVGMRITGIGIPPDTFVTQVNTGTFAIVMSRAATATNTGVAISCNSIFVGKVRERKFLTMMLGFPYLAYSGGNISLQRNLPEPLRWSNGQWSFTDTRPNLRVTADTHSNTTLDNIQRIIDGVATNCSSAALNGATVFGAGIPASTTFTSTGAASGTLSNAATASAAGVKVTFIKPISTNRYTHWALSYAVRGLGPKMQKPATSGGSCSNSNPMYPTDVGGGVTPGQPPEPVYAWMDIDITFGDLPYEVRLSSDSAVGGEYSRSTIYPEEASARFLQISGGVSWSTAAGYGQPAGGNQVSGKVFAGKEGAPKTIGENMFTWKWMDVPVWAYDWDAIQSHFGQINSTDFGSTLVAPFYVIPKECACFETAQRFQKNNVNGEPLWDIVFHFRCSPLDDRFGYWNRLYNNKGYPQRYTVKSGGTPTDFFQSFDFANLFRPYGQWV